MTILVIIMEKVAAWKVEESGISVLSSRCFVVCFDVPQLNTIMKLVQISPYLSLGSFHN